MARSPSSAPLTIGQVQYEKVTSRSFHQGPHGTERVSADDDVPLPVPRHGPVLDLRGTFRDRVRVGDLPSTIHTTPRAPLGPSRLQVTGQSATQFAPALDEEGFSTRSGTK